MRRLLQKLFGPRTPTQAKIDAATRKKYGPCPLCGKDLSKHGVTLLASAIVSDGDATTAVDLENAVASKKWNEASQFQEWRGDADELMFEIVRCPHDPRLVLIRLQAFAELWANDYVESRSVLSQEETRELLSVPGLEWRTL